MQLLQSTLSRFWSIYRPGCKRWPFLSCRIIQKKAETINKTYCPWTNRALTSCVLESGVPTVKKGKGDSGSYGRLFIARKEKWNNIYCISIVNWETLWFLHTFHFMSSFLGRLMGNDWAEHQGRVCCCRVRGWNLDFNTVLLRFNYTLYYTPCLSKQYCHLLFSKGRMTVKRTQRDSAGPRG